MTKDNEALEALAKTLAEHCDITVTQAREIIRLVGIEWGSLVREARLLKPKR